MDKDDQKKATAQKPYGNLGVNWTNLRKNVFPCPPNEILSKIFLEVSGVSHLISLD